MNNLPNSSHKDKNSLENTKHKLKANEKLTLLNLLTVILPAQKRFGTTEKEMEAIIEVWARALADYSIQQIVDATWQYVKMRPDLPSAANIINLIEYGLPDGKQERKSMMDTMPTQREIYMSNAMNYIIE